MPAFERDILYKKEETPVKYNESNKPYVCMQTQSTCYNNTRTMDVKGVLWHSTGANNPSLKRYVQPSDTPDKRDTISLAEIGKNAYGNDWNHINHDVGLNCFIGKLADGTVSTIQTMPWNYRPWGCAGGSNGSCNTGWIQFEICEDGLTDKAYFNDIYKEACEITAYLCKMYDIDPNGTVTVNGVRVPTILCHHDSYKLGMGSGHVDIDHWFPKHGKSMDTVRKDVTALLKADKSTISNSITTPSEGTTQNLYRVRKSKDDVKSQFGAYSVLDNAKAACDTAGAGYKVFDSDFMVVYECDALVENKPEPQPIQPTTPGVERPDGEPNVVAVYDLDFPEKNLIVDNSISRTDTDCVKAIKKILSNNSGFDVEIAKAFWKLAPEYHIDPMMAIAQSILETGWFKYEGSAVKPEHHNYCGLGVTSNGVEGGKFDTIEDGVTAQLQHLFAYGSKDVLDESIIDPRFRYVSRGIALYWQQLAGRWACPGYDKNAYDTPEKAMVANNTYGQKIRTIYNQLMDVSVTDADIEKYFPKKNPAYKPVVDVPTTDIADTPTDGQKTNKIVDIIFQVIKELLKYLVEIFSKGTK